MTCLAPIACYSRVHMQRCMQYKFKSPHRLSFSTLFKGQGSKSLLRLRQSLNCSPCASRLKTRSQNYNNHNKSKKVTFRTATPFRFAYSLMGWFHTWSVYLSLAVTPQVWYLQNPDVSNTKPGFTFTASHNGLSRTPWRETLPYAWTQRMSIATEDYPTIPFWSSGL